MRVSFPSRGFGSGPRPTGNGHAVRLPPASPPPPPPQADSPLSNHGGDEDEGDDGPHILDGGRRMGRCWSVCKTGLRKRLPIVTWLPKYGRRAFGQDIIAGVTVGLTVVPQSMAYAAIAGLTPEFGLYSSYVGCFLYVIFGSCRQVTIGPTAVMGLLTFETCGANFPLCAILTAFYSGFWELVMALLHLGWVVNFISEPVVLGFTAGAATTIVSSQLKNLLGLKGPKGSGFIGYWDAILTNFTSVGWPDAVMGVCSFIMLMIMRGLKDLQISRHSRTRTVLKKIFYLISVSRNVLVVLATTLTAYLYSGVVPFALTGPVLGGFPPIAIPSFALPVNSTSSTERHTVIQSFSLLGAGPVIVALISVLQNVAISKAFSCGQRIDATQEMLALGASNVVGSFFGAIPISGSFSRSAVNEASGVQSPMGGLWTGILVLLSLSFLTPTFYYIPKASLAAVIISAVIPMIEVKALRVMWIINRMDFLSCLATFVASLLLGMEYGIMLGVALSLGVLLLKSLKPGLDPELRHDPVSDIHFLYAKPDRSGLNFPSVDYIRSSVAKLATQFPSVPIIVLSFQKWDTFDYTVVLALTSLVTLLKSEYGKELVYVDCSPGWIHAFAAASTPKSENSDSGPATPVSFSDLGDFLQTKNHVAAPLELSFQEGEKSPLRKAGDIPAGGDYGAAAAIPSSSNTPTPSGSRGSRGSVEINMGNKFRRGDDDSDDAEESLNPLLSS
ncbi:sodium-independent sulfate anion transporter isoform X2 [Folsomia candida]|uniref:sodium-independent sulfate anion transporter isoform X2 n=1 Tax=Folsomia candida TaxID=158441 RepID=UPI000B8F40A1|nr:sodium-independent sulfate anion transporter isoform X2 [Folsomia candida]